MKLTAAKCPSCSANIEVNENLEKTICQYCGTTILIEEAIKTLKVELSGKIEIDGIETKKTKLDKARKHIKLKEYSDAEKILNELISDDNLDKDAYFELLKLKLNELEKCSFNNISRNSPVYKKIEKLDDIYSRIIKLDDDCSLNEDLKVIMPSIKKYRDLLSKLQEDEFDLSATKSRFQRILKAEFKYSVDFEKDQEKVFEIVNNVFQFDYKLSRTICRKEDKAFDNDFYRFFEVKYLEANGDVVFKYEKYTKNSSYNPKYYEFSRRSKIMPIDNNVMKDLVDKCDAEYDKYSRYLEGKFKRKNMFSICFILIILFICLLLSFFTIGLFVKEYILYGVLMLLLVDLWSIPLLVKKMINLISDLKFFNNFFK